MSLPRLQKGDRWGRIPTVVNALADAVDALMGTKPGPGLAKTAGGQLYATGKGGTGVKENYSGGTTLVLARSTTVGGPTNPATTWSKTVDKCPVSWIGNYVTWNDALYKLVQHERTCTYDRGGNLISIAAEVETDIETAVECVEAPA
jgi:hypothetical protein